MSQEMSAVDHHPLDPPTLPKDATPPPDTLTDDQKGMHKAVLEHFQNAEYKLPDVEKGDLMDEEKFWLSSECMLRYLRAVKWSNAKAAIQRIEETLRWRREFGLYETTPDDVKPEVYFRLL
ncbi:hypothetical protein OF83DRAFT_1173255 [Amylostereum chailletii]|nr:hypothetical protein OF83DRAFT_1173255 [Amylostereum chailletii]